jgi:hypothetical protein
MRLIEFLGESLSPIFVGKEVEAGRYYLSHSILPGSQLYGAILNQITKDEMIRYQEVEDLLKHLTVSFGFPCHIQCSGKTAFDKSFVPAPANAFSCKICDQRKTLDWKKIGTEKLLLEVQSLWCEKCRGREFKPFEGMECQGCGGSLSEWEGLERRTCVGINPKTGTSYPEEEGRLYTYDAIPKHRKFTFFICTEEKHEPIFRELNSSSIFVGRGISRGLGELKLELSETCDLKERIEKSFQTYGGDVFIELISATFGIGLGGGGIESRCEIDWAKDLEENYTEVYGEEAEVKAQEVGFWGKTSHVDYGYSQFYKAPRPKALSINSGSTVRLRVEDEISFKALLCTKFLGCGFYKHFGYGGVRIIEVA